MIKRIQQVSVKCIILKDAGVFMLKDEKGQWELPGGRMKFSEHPENALKRELKEELGVEHIQVGDLVSVWDFVVRVKGAEYQFVIIMYACMANLNRVTISSEHDGYGWLPVDNLGKYPMREGYRTAIAKYLAKTQPR